MAERPCDDEASVIGRTICHRRHGAKDASYRRYLGRGRGAVVDRRLNYGREIVARFAAQVDTRIALDLGPGLGEDIVAIRAAHPGALVLPHQEVRVEEKDDEADLDEGPGDAFLHRIGAAGYRSSSALKAASGSNPSSRPAP